LAERAIGRSFLRLFTAFPVLRPVLFRRGAVV